MGPAAPLAGPERQSCAPPPFGYNAPVPELPEVETTRRGIAPHVRGQRVREVIVREPRLRWPVPPALARELPGQRIEAVERRAKYLLFRTTAGTLIVHLGMSGSLRVLSAATPPGKHDHLDVVLTEDTCLRLRDPRRFGAVFWTREPPERHPRLLGLGPEPLDPDRFNAAYLHQKARGRRQAVKSFLMDSRIVVGVGNIYANEALFGAGIRPSTPAGRISLARFERLVETVRAVLARAIEAGGTTLRDFLDSEGRPGYFRQQLLVYGRGGEPCHHCGRPLREIRIGQRATCYCPGCQR